VATCYATAAAKSGELAVVYSFEESTASVLYRADRLGSGATELFEQKLLHIEQIDPAAQSPGEFMHGIRRKVERENASLIVIDSLNGFLNSMAGDYLASQMHDLLSFLNRRGVACILILAQTGLVGSTMITPVDVSYLADNVMLFRYFEAAGKVRKAISVLKMRGGEHEDYIRELRFIDDRLVVGQPLTNFRGVLTGVPVFTGASDALEGGVAAT
jgi:circadian clock protein KaiC